MYLISTLQANPRAKLPGRQSANLYQSEESDGEAWPSLNACWQGPALIQASAHSALHCWPDFDVMCCKWPHPSLRQFVLTFSTGTWKVDGLQVRASAARLTFGHRASVRLPFHHRTLFLSLLSAWASVMVNSGTTLTVGCELEFIKIAWDRDWDEHDKHDSDSTETAAWTAHTNLKLEGKTRGCKAGKSKLPIWKNDTLPYPDLHRDFPG